MKSMKPILFVDFDGVLCHERYWRSLPTNKYEKVQDFLFRKDKTILNDWMRGKYSSEQINQLVSEKIYEPYKTLWNIFVEDCRTMQVSQEVLNKLDNLRNRFIAVLITGNTDSFTRFTHTALELDNYFDYISNSFYEGIFKTDNNGELFLKYARKLNCSIEKCVVLDDSPNICNIFKKLGGQAYLITKDHDIMRVLKNL